VTIALGGKDGETADFFLNAMDSNRGVKINTNALTRIDQGSAFFIGDNNTNSANYIKYFMTDKDDGTRAGVIEIKTDNFKIYPGGGTIGGWNISENRLSKATNTKIIKDEKEDIQYHWTAMGVPLSNKDGTVNLASDFLVIKHYSKESDKEVDVSYPFYVRHDGTLHAEKADITAGKIGGCTISNGYISGNNWQLSGNNNISSTIGGWTIKSDGLYNGDSVFL
jgi:hypothetical protein